MDQQPKADGQPSHDHGNLPQGQQQQQQHKAVIKSVDMVEEMQHDVVELAHTAMLHHTIEKDIASYVKQEFDKKYGSTWHVIVGRNFGSYVTHETRHFIYFYLGQIAFLVFKSG
ncbi:Dynein light chain [Savitreella phatthalungensis]